jgi:hypothetical protein
MLFNVQEIIESANEDGKFLVPGQDYYLVSARWFNGWKNYVEYPQRGHQYYSHHSASSMLDSAPDKIDNSHLLDDDGELKKTVHENYDFSLLNKATWEKLHAWYVRRAE